MDIELFKQNLKFGGARTNRFFVNITNPVNSSNDANMRFYINAASLPAFTQEETKVSFFGRDIVLRGKRTFENWDVTVINDEDYPVREPLERWMDAMNGSSENKLMLGDSSPSNYKSQGFITHYSQTDQPLRTYKFVGLMPVNISAIELSWGEDNISSFNATFAFDYYDVEGQTTSNRNI